MHIVATCALFLSATSFASTLDFLESRCMGILRYPTLHAITSPRAADRDRAFGSALKEAVDRNNQLCLHMLRYVMPTDKGLCVAAVEAAIQHAIDNNRTVALRQLLSGFYNSQKCNFLPKAAELYSVAVENGRKEHVQILGEFLHCFNQLTQTLLENALTTALSHEYFGTAAVVFDRLRRRHAPEGISIIMDFAKHSDVSPMINYIAYAVEKDPNSKALASAIASGLLALHAAEKSTFVSTLVIALGREYVFKSFDIDSDQAIEARDNFIRDLEASGIFSCEDGYESR